MLCKLEKEAKRKSRKVDIVSFLGTLVWCFSWLIPSFQGFTVKTSTENEERTQLNSKCSLLRDRLHNNNCREMVSVCKLGRNRQSNRFQRRQIGEKNLFSPRSQPRVDAPIACTWNLNVWQAVYLLTGVVPLFFVRSSFFRDLAVKRNGESYFYLTALKK